MSPFAPRMVVRANVLYIAFVSLPTRGPVPLKGLLVRSRCLSFYYFYVYIIARSRSNNKARLSHFADEASGGITSSSDGTYEDSLGEEEENEEESGKCTLLRFKQEDSG